MRYGPQNGEEIIAHSSNVGIAKIAEKMGADVYYSFLRNLGFGQTARTNFYGIKKGTLRPTYKWSQFSLHSISYGQEIGVTQLQLANAYCAIANGGTLMKPIIIKRITDPNGKLVEEEAPTPIRKIASKKSIKTMQGFLGKVFEYGTAKRYNNSTIGLAGKTGTAEVKSLKTRGSDKWEYTSSFVGYLPIDDPKYVIVVTYDKPKRKFRYAASSALPSFEKVYQTILDLPDNNLKITYEIRQKNFISMPSLIDMTIEDAKDLLQAKNINYHCETSDNKRIVKTQFPKAGTSFSPDERPVSFSSDKFDTENNDELIPNYIGMSLREAMKLSLSKNIKTNIKGSGVIYKQSLKAGLTIDSEKLLILEARAN
ncbi:MAG: hypothetical protein B6226_06250 [Candidatus Cloacimonetes bacterium 4572_65]|nr:MAG: hypothetical protein B6226_06250 [Candidatus Cloacimonetes bacterium 4572_65]